MASSPSARATRWISSLVDGHSEVAEELFPVVYEKLRAIAGSILRDAKSAPTLQPTALVHEAYVKLTDVDQLDWRGKAQFAAIAARAMRQILVDHVRSRRRQKRGGGWRRVTLQGVFEPGSENEFDLLDLDAAMVRLKSHNERAAQVVELTYFACMTQAEIAEVLGVAPRTVHGDLAWARLWLRREMSSGSGSP